MSVFRFPFSVARSTGQISRIRQISLICLISAAAYAADHEVQLVVAKAITPDMADNGSPVKIPALEYYQKLWTESILTTRALPPPEAPSGPKFTDNLTLTGSYELDGKVVAVLIDRTTNNVVEAYIGEENAEGMKIVEVDGKSAADIQKVKLQKGTEIGWVALPDPNNPEGGAPPPGVPGTSPQNVMQPGMNPAMTPGGLMPNPLGAGAQRPANIPQPSAPAPAMPPQSIMPQNVPPVPVAHPVVDDIPLPPL